MNFDKLKKTGLQIWWIATFPQKLGLIQFIVSEKILFVFRQRADTWTDDEHPSHWISSAGTVKQSPKMDNVKFTYLISYKHYFGWQICRLTLFSWLYSWYKSSHYLLALYSWYSTILSVYVYENTGSTLFLIKMTLFHYELFVQRACMFSTCIENDEMNRINSRTGAPSKKSYTYHATILEYIRSWRCHFIFLCSWVCASLCQRQTNIHGPSLYT